MTRRRVLFRTWLAALGAMCTVTTAVGSAQTISLNVNSLPTAQGWTYQGNVLETAAFSVDGTKLTVNTIGQISAATAIYFRQNVINPNLPFTVSLRARVIQVEANGHFGVSSFTGTEAAIFLLRANGVRFQAQDFAVDTTQFHDYRLVFIPGLGSSLFVDGLLVGNLPPFPVSVSQNSVLFGDGSGGPLANVHGELEQFTFSQTVAESIEALSGQLSNLPSATGLVAKLDNALGLLNSGKKVPGCNLLNATYNEVQSLVGLGIVTSATGATLSSLISSVAAGVPC